MYPKSRRKNRLFTVKKKKTFKKGDKGDDKDEYEKVVDAIMLFNYKTDAEQFFNSDEEKQKHLVASTKALRDSVNKYIQTRNEQF